MMYSKGFVIVYVDNQWVYEDTGESIKEVPRACRRCGSWPTDEGHDACLGTLPGVDYACCGHGEPDRSYVRFTNGTSVRGFTNVYH